MCVVAWQKLAEGGFFNMLNYFLGEAGDLMAQHMAATMGTLGAVMLGVIVCLRRRRVSEALGCLPVCLHSITGPVELNLVKFFSNADTIGE